MREVLVAAGLVALLGLSACSPSKTETTEAAAAPAPAKSLARQQQFYAGQEQLQAADSATIALGKSGALEIAARGSAAGAGYTNLGFMRRIYAGPPKDGIYELDIVGDKPAGGAAVVTAVDVKGAWESYPKDRLKGVRLMTKTNSVVAMLPPA
jgi:hypothetical protein